MNKEKRYIPHTNPKWGCELPDNKYNSLVDKHGRSHDDGYNFDESMDKEEKEESIPKFNPEAAKKAREEAIHTQQQSQESNE